MPWSIERTLIDSSEIFEDAKGDYETEASALRAAIAFAEDDRDRHNKDLRKLRRRLQQIERE